MEPRTLTLPIRAEGWERSGLHGRVHFKQPRTRSLEARIGWEWQVAKLGWLSGPLSLRVVAEYAPPASWSVRKKEAAYGAPYAQRPDWDNCGKLISDALNGVAYDDDRQIAEASIRQVYAPADRLTIELREMADA